MKSFVYNRSSCAFHSSTLLLETGSRLNFDLRNCIEACTAAIDSEFDDLFDSMLSC